MQILGDCLYVNVLGGARVRVEAVVRVLGAVTECERWRDGVKKGGERGRKPRKGVWGGIAREACRGFHIVSYLRRVLFSKNNR